MTDEKKTTELKPCPKCKCGAIEKYPVPDSYTKGGWQEYGSCFNCGYTENLETWNHRPIEDALKRDIEELKDLVEEIKGATRVIEVQLPHPTCATCDSFNSEPKYMHTFCELEENLVVDKDHYCKAHSALNQHKEGPS